MVDKDAMFDELSKRFPPGKYTTFCNKMGVGYNEAKRTLMKCREDYEMALRDVLTLCDDRMKDGTTMGLSRKQLEVAMVGAEVGGLCDILEKHYGKASTEVVAATGDGALHDTRNQGGSPSTIAASKEVNDVEQASTVRKRGGDPASSIKVVRETETPDGNISKTAFILNDISKEHMTFLCIIVLCFVVGVLILKVIQSFGKF